MQNTALPNHPKLPTRPIVHVVAEPDCPLVVVVVADMINLGEMNMEVMMIMEEMEAQDPSSSNPQKIIRY